VRSRTTALIAIVSINLLGISAPIVAHAAGVTDLFNGGLFELDGNIVRDASAASGLPCDWGNVVGTQTPACPSPPLLAKQFVADPFVNGSDPTAFTNGSKDNLDVSAWACTNKPFDAKNDILNAYAAVFQEPANAASHANDLVLYMAQERRSNNGDAFAGFWLLKNSASCVSPATGSTNFTGSHAEGDLLVVSNYTNGGGTNGVTVYEWHNGALNLTAFLTGPNCSAATASDLLCTIANNATLPQPSWGPQPLAPNEFVETGIDLTSVFKGAPPCFSNFVAETRSSQAPSADLHDFALGRLSTCPTPSVVTQIKNNGANTGSVTVGTTVTDTATISLNGVTQTGAGGSVTFTVYSGTGSSVCAPSGTVVGSPVTVNMSVAHNGTATATFANLPPGNYEFQAVYTPDANTRLAASTSTCGSEPLTVNKAQPSISTTQSAGGIVGIAINDTASVTGGFNPTGTVTFRLYPPSDSTCAGTPVLTDTEPLGTASVSYNTTTVGTYRWVATYNGDANNLTATSGCQAEPVVITKAQPNISTTQSAGGPVGTSINDTASVTGGFNPTGTVTFRLYPPSDPTCAGTPVFTNTQPLGTASASYNTTTVGTYRWVATYNGDANNLTATSGCQAEPVVITKAQPTISTTASATVVVGGSIHDTATLAAGFHPTGTITFTLFGPNDTNCTGSPVFTSIVTVNGNGNYTSASFKTTAAGTYRFKAAYSGDANNLAAASNCNDAGESVLVTTPNSTLVKAERDVTTPDTTTGIPPGGFSAGPITAHPLDVLEYRLTYINGGQGAASLVTVTDVVPVAHSAYVAGSCTGGTSCSYDSGSHTVTWDLGTVNGGGTQVVMTFQIKLTAATDFPAGVTTQISNAAVVTTFEEGSLPSSNTVVAKVLIPVQQVLGIQVTLPQAGFGPLQQIMGESGSGGVIAFAGTLLLAMICAVVYESVRRQRVDAEDSLV
jgi:hypothetical protein